MDLCSDALKILSQTSRTFYIPISRLPPRLQKTVASAYLCLRAIDQIEDHPELDKSVKIELLQNISLKLQAGVDSNSFDDFLLTPDVPYPLLEEVTIRIGELSVLAPETIAPRIWEATAAMSSRMAYWASCNWEVNTESDLNRYTFSVAGTVGLLLSDLWAWYDGTQTNRTHAIGFGRGLQAVNILRNYPQDRTRGVNTRGVNFFPNSWSDEDMHSYARRHLVLADAYTNALPNSPAKDFCQIPLALAYATLDTLSKGKEKLSRSAVLNLVDQVSSPQR